MATTTNSPDSFAPIRIIRLKQVLELTGLGRSTVYKLEADQKFPKRVQLGARAVGWIQHEIEGWLSAHIEQRHL